MNVHRVAPWPALASIALIAGCMTAPPSASRAPIFHPSSLDLPFSEAVQVGDVLILSGQIGAPPGKAELVQGGLKAEAVQVLENVKGVLEKHGASLDDVVKCTVFLADMKEWPDFNDVYRGYFRKHFPARSALGANGLALGARVELECFAVIPPRA